MIYQDECKKAGIDKKLVASIANRIERACKDAEKLGIQVFMGSNSNLRFYDGEERPLILADIMGNNLTGGDGGTCEDEHGLTRGESMY